MRKTKSPVTALARAEAISPWELMGPDGRSDAIWLARCTIRELRAIGWDVTPLRVVKVRRKRAK